MKWIVLAFFSVALFTPEVRANTENLDFEHVLNGKQQGWKQAGKVSEYKFDTDEHIVQSGKRSVSIEFTGEQIGFSSWAQGIPADFHGKTITLRGFIKAKDVVDGWAGLWLRVHPKLAFNDMRNNPVVATSEWQPYEVTVDYQATEAERILFGGYLVGKGKVWFDNFEILVDGKAIELAATKDVKIKKWIMNLTLALA